jgi:hypothetical protein
MRQTDFPGNLSALTYGNSVFPILARHEPMEGKEAIAGKSFGRCADYQCAKAIQINLSAFLPSSEHSKKEFSLLQGPINVSIITFRQTTLRNNEFLPL